MLCWLWTKFFFLPNILSICLLLWYVTPGEFKCRWAQRRHFTALDCEFIFILGHSFSVWNHFGRKNERMKYCGFLKRKPFYTYFRWIRFQITFFTQNLTECEYSISSYSLWHRFKDTEWFKWLLFLSCAHLKLLQDKIILMQTPTRRHTSR